MLRCLLRSMAFDPHDRTGVTMRRVYGYKGGGRDRIPARQKLGNKIARWLAWFGITKARWRAARGQYRIIGGCGTAMLVKISKAECGCRERQRALNKVSARSARSNIPRTRDASIPTP